MAEDRIARMQRKMLELQEELRGWMNDLQKLPKKWMTDFQEETSKWIDDLLKDAFDPRKMMQFLKAKGIDMDQFSQMFGRMAQTGAMPQGFDPYLILRLDKSASEEEVKKRYREMMGKIHPDKAGEEMACLAAIVNGAYATIKKMRGWQ